MGAAAWIENFLDSWPWMASWKDPERVWAFQKRFGVEKVKTVEVKPGAPFAQVDHDEWLERRRYEQTRRTRHAAAALTAEAATADAAANAGSNCVSSSGYSSAAETGEEAGRNVVFYRIRNWLWYYVFLFGTQLGDETYYSIFFSFWFWNIDGAVGRRVILMWNIIMYIGQGMKDIIRWPRPSVPPVVQLERKWALEYGMPSTHAMVGFSVPISILYFTIGRYQYPFLVWAIAAIVWCLLVCSSRIYLGMHSLADIYVGLIFGSFLAVFVLPLVDRTDFLLMSHPLAPAVTIPLSIAGILYYPGSDRWTPARGDTTVILGSYLGVHLAVWSNYQLGLLRGPPLPPPYPILWPTYAQYGQTLLRMVVGAVILVATRAIFKPLSYFAACYVMNKDMKVLKSQKEDIKNKHKIYAELTYKFCTYVAIGFNTMFLAPIVFQVMGIERSTFYTEV